ncbi:hypothetical protein B1B_12627, partial [mine drainage metagenome]
MTDSGSGVCSALDIRTESGFATAVREALRDFHRPHKLHTNPLLTARLVAAVCSGEPATPPAQALREILRTHCERLGDNAKLDRYKQVLMHTYVAPLRSQQGVAETLHLSWSTYRRRLAEATQMLAAVLWEAESACGVPLVKAQDIMQEAGATQPSPQHSVTPPVRRWGWFAAVAAVLLLLMAGADVMLLYAPPRRAAPRARVVAVSPRTLAVLPFLDVNHDPATRYLSDGMTDELIARLGRTPHATGRCRQP